MGRCKGALFCFFFPLLTFYCPDPLSFIFFIHPKTLVVFIYLIPCPYPCQGCAVLCSFASIHPLAIQKLPQVYFIHSVGQSVSLIFGPVHHEFNQRLHIFPQRFTIDKPFSSLENKSKTSLTVVPITKAKMHSGPD